MSRIIFQNFYFVILPTFSKADLHKHPMLHVFYGKEGCNIIVNDIEYSGKTIILDSDIKHYAEIGRGCELLILIDPTCVIAEQLQDKYLRESKGISVLDADSIFPDNLWKKTDEELVRLTERLFSNLGIENIRKNVRDSRVEKVTQHLISGEWLHLKIPEIAERVCLSESRLTHLFKDEMGISLKNYIVSRKMEYAYKYVTAGGKITHAAYEAGFSSSAHLAYTCKKLTGVSIREVMKDDRFLKV